ncbi:MAG TPA: hypothetical protein VH302_00165 [Bryobacteraceae bacterium]|jgi:hypothetical protein|nr:hypothetical protein [Bryobacteraceae bacterium]
MAENGEIPSTGDPRVDAALQRIRGKFRDLEDAMVVQAHMEKRMSAQIKAHADWLATHEENMRRHEEWLAGHEEKMSEIDDKINFIVDREMRREGGPEGRR